MSGTLQWDKVEPLPWRMRYAFVERSVRTHLAGKPGLILSTWDLARVLTGHDHDRLLTEIEHKQVTKLAQLLSKMAPHMGPLATHDGAKIVRYRRQWQRWQWRGQN